MRGKDKRFARYVDGYVVVPYTGDELSRVEMSIGDSEYQSAFLDWVDEERVILLPLSVLSQDVRVRVRIDGQETHYRIKE